MQLHYYISKTSSIESSFTSPPYKGVNMCENGCERLKKVNISKSPLFQEPLNMAINWSHSLSVLIPPQGKIHPFATPIYIAVISEPLMQLKSLGFSFLSGGFTKLF